MILAWCLHPIEYSILELGMDTGLLLGNRIWQIHCNLYQLILCYSEGQVTYLIPSHIKDVPNDHSSRKISNSEGPRPTQKAQRVFTVSWHFETTQKQINTLCVSPEQKPQLICRQTSNPQKL